MTHVFPCSFSSQAIHSPLFALRFRYVSGYGARPTRILYVGDSALAADKKGSGGRQFLRRRWS